MTEAEIEDKLNSHPRTNYAWYGVACITVHREGAGHVQITYSDFGAGAVGFWREMASLFPGCGIDVDVEGGCDTCGHGQGVIVDIRGTLPDWL